MRAPFLHVVPSYVAGILLGRWFDVPLPLLVLVTTGCSVALFFKPKYATTLLFVALSAAGWMNHDWRTRVLSPHDLRAVVDEAPVLTQVVGTISEEPTIRKHVRAEKVTWSTQVLVDVAKLIRDGTEVDAHGQVLVRHPGLLDEAIRKGCVVQAFGVLDHPPDNRIPGLFNYRTHLANQGVHHILETEFTDDWEVLDAASDPFAFLRGFRDWARSVMTVGLPEEDGIVELLHAMTLGWKAGLTQEVREPFMQSGTMHIFAISGLHIAIVGAILIELVRVFGFTRRQSAGAVIVLLWCYVVATGEQPSAIRAATMMTVVLGGLMLKRPSNLPNSVAAAAVLILLVDPLSLFQIGFQLSFSVVGTLAILGPAAEKWIERFRFGDPFLPDELQPRWQSWMQSGARWLARSLSVSLAAWLGSLPLVALYFNYLTPGSLLANLMVVPLSLFTIASVFASWITAAMHLAMVSEWFNWSAWFLMTGMVRCSEWIAGLEFAWSNVRSPHPLVLVGYYVMVLAIGTGWFVRTRRNVMATAMLTLAVIGMVVVPDALSRHASIWLLPLGGGHSVKIDDLGGGETLLVDCGDAYTFDSVTKPWLRWRGTDRIGNVAFSHGDARHMAAAENLLAEFGAGRTFTPDARFRSTYFRALEESLASVTNRWSKVSLGDSVTRFRVVHPPGDTSLMKADDVALALVGDLRGWSVLLLPDPTVFSQEEILKNNPGFTADIVIVGLPEADEFLSSLFLDQLQPSLVIVCSDLSPTSAVESPYLREIERASDYRFLFTSDTGGLELRLTENNLKAVGPLGDINLRVERQKSPRP